MADFMNIADGLIANEDSRQILDVIEQIMSIPEESLDETSTEVIAGMISGALTPRIREASIKSVLEGFEDENFSRAQAEEIVKQNKEAIKGAIEEINPSPNKRALLDATFDFVYASKDMILPAHSLSNKVPTGLRIALPEGWVAKIAPRSSIGAKTGLRLSNSIGIIDADYRGEIIVLYDNISDSDYEIKAGDRIAQMWVERVERFKPVTVDILPATERGDGGFGSTGK